MPFEAGTYCAAVWVHTNKRKLRHNCMIRITKLNPYIRTSHMFPNKKYFLNISPVAARSECYSLHQFSSIHYAAPAVRHLLGHLGPPSWRCCYLGASMYCTIPVHFLQPYHPHSTYRSSCRPFRLVDLRATWDWTSLVGVSSPPPLFCRAWHAWPSPLPDCVGLKADSILLDALAL